MMKKLGVLCWIFFAVHIVRGQCPGTPISVGSCLTNESFTSAGSGWMAGCNGGSNPWSSYRFVAPAGCVQFDITNIASQGTGLSWQYRIINSTCSAYAGTAFRCVDEVSDGFGFSITGDNLTGIYQLTPGTTYVLQLMGDNSAFYNICMSGTNEDPSNECTGAMGLGTGSTTFYNGGAGCEFSGSYTDPTTTDLAAGEYCAGSLENSQWIKFSPVAGVTSFQISGSNINCTGGGCGYQFGIFSGSCSALVSEGCVSNGIGCGPGPDPNIQNNKNSADGYSVAWGTVTTTSFSATITRSSGAAFTGSEVFYLVMDGNAASNCTYTMQGINVAPVPIDLAYFRGNHVEEGNYIEWATRSERENDYFILEYSRDASDWQIIQRIDGSGNTSSLVTYEYLDTNFDLTQNYYRLKQVDYNGLFEIHHVVAIDNRASNDDIIGVYDLLGRPTDVNFKGPRIILYRNGTSVKKF